MAELPLDQMVYNVIDEGVYKDHAVTTNRHYKFISAAEDGSQLKLYISSALEYGADRSIHPVRLYKALYDNVGPFPPQSVNYMQDIDLEAASFDVWDYVVDWYVKAFDYLIENEDVTYIFSHLHNIDMTEHGLFVI